jgi:hypothetical protein
LIFNQAKTAGSSEPAFFVGAKRGRARGRIPTVCTGVVIGHSVFELGEIGQPADAQDRVKTGGKSDLASNVM